MLHGEECYEEWGIYREQQFVCFALVYCGLNRDVGNKFGIVDWDHFVSNTFRGVLILAVV